MGVLVQKFGGTSLQTADARRRVAEWVQSALDRGDQPVVVVSAMGRRGDPYATDTLLDLLAESGPVEPRERDLLVSTGEIVSAVVMTAELRRHGVPAGALTGTEIGIVTDDAFGSARILEVDPRPVQQALARGGVPVVAGFQGVTRWGAIATLGRGGSDTTAAALGAALSAQVVEIFTDVDGIKTADPRIVPEARTIRRLDYDEVFQLANLGARVIHPRAVEIARQFHVPIRVRSTFEDHPGTRIGPAPDRLDPWAHRRPEEAVTGVAHLGGLCQFWVGPGSESSGWRERLFSALGEAGVSVDLVNLYPDGAFFCVPEEARPAAEELLSRLGYPFRVQGGRAKVSIVGSAIQGLPGVVGRVMTALGEAGVMVWQSADSHSTVSLLVAEADVERAVQALHRQFGLERERRDDGDTEAAAVAKEDGGRV